MKSKKVLFVSVLLILVAGLVMAAAPSPFEDIPDTVGGFFVWLGSAGVVGIVLSSGLKQWVWYQARPRWLKWVLALVVALVIMIGAKCALLYIPGSPYPPPDLPTAWAFMEFWYPTIAQAVIVFIASGIWNDKYINSLPADKQGSLFAE